MLVVVTLIASVCLGISLVWNSYFRLPGNYVDVRLETGDAQGIVAWWPVAHARPNTIALAHYYDSRPISHGAVPGTMSLLPRSYDHLGVLWVNTERYGVVVLVPKQAPLGSITPMRQYKVYWFDAMSIESHDALFQTPEVVLDLSKASQIENVTPDDLQDWQFEAVDSYTLEGLGVAD